MATLNHSTDINHLIINIVPNQSTYDDMVTNNQINTEELYFIPGSGPKLAATINGVSYEYDTTEATVLPNMYVPTTAGTANQILISNGSGNAPSWTSPISTITSSSTGIPNAAAVREYVANNAVSSMAKLTIGTYEYDGSTAVTIPVYNGTIV